MVEPQPSKLIVWVRFPSPAPTLKTFTIIVLEAHIAQAVEHFLGKEEVAGSIPVVGTTKNLINETGRFSDGEGKI